MRTAYIAAGVLAALAGPCVSEDKPHAAETPSPTGAGDKNGSPSESEQAKHIRKLIELLGSDSYGVRNQATQDLKDLGRPAIEALEYAAEDDDPEIRARATDLLIDMRGRGFMGVMLQETWDGQPFNTQLMQEDEEEEEPQEEAPAVEGKPAARGPKPPPELVATEVQTGLGRPAEVAGVKDGDKFVSVAGKPVHGLIDLLRAVIMAGPGKRIMVVVERDGTKQTLWVDLMCNPDDHPRIDLMSEVEPERRPKPVPVQPPEAQQEQEQEEDVKK